MKYFILSVIMQCCSLLLMAQQYPEPEFSNEVYWLKKENGYKITRLEKGSSKMVSKNKMGGFGGSESAYILDGEKSTVRIENYKNLSFVYSNGTSSSKSSSAADSMMQANGIDVSAMSNMMSSMNDPSKNIVLYKVEQANGKRKILLQKNPGMSPFGSKKQKTGDKFTFSVKKIREGYWELVVDKSLNRGEYVFAMMGTGSSDGSIVMFAFAVE
jgi:hypothetical protein